MNTKSKIKELIENYKDAIPRALGEKSRSAFKQIVKDLESLLEPECDIDELEQYPSDDRQCYYCGDESCDCDLL